MLYRKLSKLFGLLAALFLPIACNQLSPLFPATPSPTFTPAPTFAPTLFAYLTPSAQAGPFVPFYGLAWTDTEVRAGPGATFPTITKVHPHTDVLVLGKSVGDEWLYVQLRQGGEGWTFARWIQIYGEPMPIPVIQPANSQMIIGRVVDESGQPVNGVRISIFRFVEDYGIGTGGTTDRHGFLYAFMPLEASGEWLVGYDSLDCNSNKMPPKCACAQRKCGQPYPQTTTVTLPQTSPLLFVWK